MKKIVFFILIFISSISFAEEIIRINEIIIEGHKKTKEQTILDIIEIKSGDIYNAEIKDRIEQALLKSYLFSKIDITTKPSFDNQVDISISLKEKITLIPLPIVSADKDSWNAGLILMDVNAFGTGNILIISVIIGSQNQNFFMLMFMDPRFRDTSFSYGFSMMYGKNEQKTESNNYTKTSLGGRTNLGIALSNKWNISFNPSLSWRTMTGIDINESSFFVSKPSIGLSYSNIYHKETIQEGIKSSFIYNPSWEINRNIYHWSQISFDWSKIVFQKHIFKAGVNTGIGNLPDYDMNSIGGKSGSRNLPQGKILSNQYISGLFEFDATLFDFSWGTISIPIFFDGGVYKAENNLCKYFYGPGTGFSVYLKGVAVPALGMYAAYNLENLRFEGSFSLGLSF